MALNAVEQNLISKACAAAKTLEDLKGILSELDYLYNGAPNYKAAITQADLDLVTSFSGLTKTQLDDGLFALTSTILTPLSNSLNQLINLAVRG